MLDSPNFIFGIYYRPSAPSNAPDAAKPGTPDRPKTVAQYNRYKAMLGSNLAGTANARQDVCYHKQCDDVTIINQFALEKMLQAAAYAVENPGQQSDLKTWLYPTRILHQQIQEEQTFEYNSINEYLGLPYD